MPVELELMVWALTAVAHRASVPTSAVTAFLPVVISFLRFTLIKRIEEQNEAVLPRDRHCTIGNFIINFLKYPAQPIPLIEAEGLLEDLSCSLQTGVIYRAPYCFMVIVRTT